MPANPIGTAYFYTTAFPNRPALLSDGDDIVTRNGTVASGIGVITRGTICNIVPSTGVITVPSTLAGCNCVMMDDIDSTAATVSAMVLLSGKVKADALTWPGALAHGDVSDYLRDYGILVEAVMGIPGSIVKSTPTEAEAAEAKKRLEAAREALKKSLEPPKPEEEEKLPPADSILGYLTPEEQEKASALAEFASVAAVTAPHARHPAHETHPSHEEANKKTPPPPPAKR